MRGDLARRCARLLETAGDARIDYVALVDPRRFSRSNASSGRVLAALAVRIDDTRLIDNCILEPIARVGRMSTVLILRSPREWDESPASVLQTLFYIPSQVGGLPVFGFGLLLAAWTVFGVVLLAWLDAAAGP